MAYSKGKRLSYESASKLGHINVINSEWIQSLIKDFEDSPLESIEYSCSNWERFDPAQGDPLINIWAVDGSFVSINSDNLPRREVGIVKNALMQIDQRRLEQIDKRYPHPLLLQDIMRDSAIFHATIFPLRNIRTSKGNNYDTIRHIIKDSIKLSEGGQFFETLKWLAYEKWKGHENIKSPSFACPHCIRDIPGLPYNSDDGMCPTCGKTVYLTDMIGFHLEMDEDFAPESIPSAYMSVMEHLMLFTAIRLYWEMPDKRPLSETLFIKDGPLSLRGQYSKLVPRIRSFLQYAKDNNRPVHIIGQEKSGMFVDHLSTLASFAPPKEIGELPAFMIVTHEYVRREVQRTSVFSSPYGSRTNWGEKVYVKLDPNTFMVISIPTGDYIDDDNFPLKEDLIGLDRILATLPGIISRKYEGALYPIELVNGIASLSSYPSAKILQQFVEDIRKGRKNN